MFNVVIEGCGRVRRIPFGDGLQAGPRASLSRFPAARLAAAIGSSTLALLLLAGFHAGSQRARPLSIDFERRVLTPPGEAPLNLRFFSAAVKTDSHGRIITGPTSDPVKHLVGAEPAGERGGVQRYTKILFGANYFDGRPDPGTRLDPYNQTVKSGSQFWPHRDQPFRSWPNALALTPDGTRLATGSDDGETMLWDASETGTQALKSVKQPKADDIYEAAPKLPFRLTGMSLKAFPPRSWDGLLAVRLLGARAEVWQVVTGVKQCILEGTGADITLVAISRDKTRIATTGDRTVQVWDALTGKRVCSLDGHAASVTALDFSEGSRRLVSGSADATAKVWDITNGKLMYTLRGHTGKVSTVQFHCGERRIVTGAADGFAFVWDAQSGRLVCKLAGQATSLTGLKMSGDARRICIMGNALTLWDGINGKKITELIGIRPDSMDIAFSPDSRRIIIGSYGGHARMYETETGRDVLSISIGGADNWRTTVAFSPDGNRLDLHNGSIAPVSFQAKY